MQRAERAAATGDTHEAIRSYTAVIDGHANVPVVSDALYARARLRFALGALTDARADLERAIREFPSPRTIDPAGLFLAEILFVLGETEAIEMLERQLPMLESSGVAEEFAAIRAEL